MQLVKLKSELIFTLVSTNYQRNFGAVYDKTQNTKIGEKLIK